MSRKYTIRRADRQTAALWVTVDLIEVMCSVTL